MSVSPGSDKQGKVSNIMMIMIYGKTFVRSSVSLSLSCVESAQTSFYCCDREDFSQMHTTF